MFGLVDTGGPRESVYTGTHVSAGTVRVRASESAFPLVTEAAGELAGYIEPIHVEQQVDYGRFDDCASWNGGNYVNARWGSVDNWVGGTSTSSSLPAYDVYPWYALPYGAQLLVSGSTTGQGTVEFRGTPPDGCVMREGSKKCRLISTVAPSNIGAGGDSGGPGAVYDPTNGRLIPVGIIQGGTSPVSGSHWLDLTTTQAIVYLYGGATIG